MTKLVPKQIKELAGVADAAMVLMLQEKFDTLT